MQTARPLKEQTLTLFILNGDPDLWLRREQTIFLGEFFPLSDHGFNTFKQ